MNKIETYRKLKTCCVRERDRWDREKHRGRKRTNERKHKRENLARNVNTCSKR